MVHAGADGGYLVEQIDLMGEAARELVVAQPSSSVGPHSFGC
jgi:hypothetical protein